VAVGWRKVIIYRVNTSDESASPWENDCRRAFVDSARCEKGSRYDLENESSGFDDAKEESFG
jgi:hypothetical protein